MACDNNSNPFSCKRQKSAGCPCGAPGNSAGACYYHRVLASEFRHAPWTERSSTLTIIDGSGRCEDLEICRKVRGIRGNVPTA